MIIRFLSRYKVRTVNRSNSVDPLQAHTIFSGLDLDLGMHSSALSRQDTLPADDPSWSYPQVPGRPAPIPPRNEPLLYIPSTVHAQTTWCSKNLQVVYLPPSTTSESESVLNDMKPNDLSTYADKVLITSASTDIINPEHYSAKRAMNSQVYIIDMIPFYAF